MIDWNDPAARAHLIQKIGPTKYNEALAAHQAASSIETVNGYSIRPVHSLFGALLSVAGTSNAYKYIEDARRYANSLPAAPPSNAIPTG